MISEQSKAYLANLLSDPDFMLLLNDLEALVEVKPRLWSADNPVTEEEFANTSGQITGQKTIFNLLRGKL